MNRTVAPQTTLPKQAELVFPEKIILENGIELYWMKDVKDNSVKLDFEWFAGSKYQTKKLSASFANKLLLSGNAKKSAKEIAEEIDYYGGFTQDEVDKDHGAITLYGLVENMQSILAIFADAFLNCEYPEKEIEDERKAAITKFKIDKEKVKYICQRNFNESLFGKSHPYGQLADEEDFVNLNRNDIVEFYQKYYRETKPVIFLVGNVDNDFIDSLKKFSAQLGSKNVDWKKQAISPTKGKQIIEKADALQTAIRVGRPMVNKKHADYFGLQVLDTILGGYFGSRLMANIREDKGYTYGIGSAIAVMDDAAYFIISTEVAKEVREQTLHEIFVELDKLKTEAVSHEELQRVKNYMLGEFLRQADGPTPMMESFKNIWFNQLPNSYYSDFVKAVHQINADDLKRLAQTYFVREEMVEILAG